jgi:hypothetical protein
MFKIFETVELPELELDETPLITVELELFVDFFVVLVDELLTVLFSSSVSSAVEFVVLADVLFEELFSARSKSIALHILKDANNIIDIIVIATIFIIFDIL